MHLSRNNMNYINSRNKHRKWMRWSSIDSSVLHSFGHAQTQSGATIKTTCWRSVIFHCLNIERKKLITCFAHTNIKKIYAKLGKYFTRKSVDKKAWRESEKVKMHKKMVEIGFWILKWFSNLIVKTSLDGQHGE